MKNYPAMPIRRQKACPNGASAVMDPLSALPGVAVSRAGAGAAGGHLGLRRAAETARSRRSPRQRAGELACDNY